MPILGITASSISGNLITNSYVSISTTTLSTSTATVTLSSIPATFTHLQVRCIARSTQAAANFGILMYFNGITTQASNYSAHALRGNGSSASAFGGTTESIQSVGAGANATSGVFGAVVWDILDYTNTNKNKVVRALGGYDNNGDGIIQLSSGMLYSSRPVISSITFATTGNDFAQYSQFALYGIKGV